MGHLYLKWVDAKGQEQTFPLEAEETVIGRKSDAGLHLQDPYLSRHHAKLVRSGKSYALLDLQSTHGTFVNGTRLSAQHLLQPGDVIVLGPGRVKLTFCKQMGQSGYDTTTLEAGMKKSLAELTSVFPAIYTSHSDLEKLSFLLDLQYNWGRNFSASATFEQILASAVKISGAERGFILMKSEDGFEYVVGRNRNGETLSHEQFVQTSQSIVRQVEETGEAAFMNEGIADELVGQDSIVAMKLKALACLPLKWISTDSELAVRGILYLDSTSIMHALSGLDQKLLNKLAAEAGNVFEKLEMVETLEERRVFEQELALAQETQQHLLPQNLPELKEYTICAFSQPTRHVGGDFYDFLDAAGGKLIGLLADVSGKGISAALLSSLLQGALDIMIRDELPPAEALNRINRLLFQRSQSNRFVTLFLFTLTPEGTGEFIGAGHTPTFLYRSRQAAVEALASENMILGAFREATYSSLPLRLETGDVLVVYSDGLTEAQNPEGKMFEEERLIELIRREAQAGAEVLEMKILQALEEFTQGRAQTDDITLLLIERR